MTSTTAARHRSPSPLPAMRATIARRLLVNYRLDPDRAAALLPSGLSPQLVNGYAVAGICLIRLSRLRPAGIPARLGLTTENAAHRIAVTWRDQHAEQPRVGVFIPQRHSDSALTTALGGRLYPGLHRRADFTVTEDLIPLPPTSVSADATPVAGSDDAARRGLQGELSVAFTSRDRRTSAAVTARLASSLTGSRLFADTAAASAFFAAGSCGYSPTRTGRALEGMRLDTTAWSVHPCASVEAHSSLFEDSSQFPPGSAELDSALLMHDVPVTWSALPAPSGTRG